MPVESLLARPHCDALGIVPSPYELCPAFLDQPYCLLLDSAMNLGGLGRYSYLTADPFLVLRSKGDRVEVEAGGRVERRRGDPFRELQTLLRQYRCERLPGLPPFQGGAAGYFAYELGRHIERLPATTIDDYGFPELYVGFYDWVLAHDHQTGESWLIATGGSERSADAANRRIDWAWRRIQDQLAWQSTEPLPVGRSSRPVSNFEHGAYLRAVQAVKEYILAGDVYQVNLSQRFAVQTDLRPWQLYRRLHSLSAAPFAAFLQFPELCVLSASPEEFLRLDGRRIRTRPIKGTRPRGRTPDEDRRLADELVSSVKDRAENLMIVDLLRNDVGRVATIGSVRVPELFALETFPTVFHLTSTVTAELREELDAVDLLRACFPGGSITGAPKIRAMEIIDELEPTVRSVYCGAIGYISFAGDMLTNIPIRTMLMRGDRVWFQVGGGIVADSDPEGEYQETLHKARGALLALGCDD